MKGISTQKARLDKLWHAFRAHNENKFKNNLVI